MNGEYLEQGFEYINIKFIFHALITSSLLLKYLSEFFSQYHAQNNDEECKIIHDNPILVGYTEGMSSERKSHNVTV